MGVRTTSICRLLCFWSFWIKLRTMIMASTRRYHVKEPLELQSSLGKILDTIGQSGRINSMNFHKTSNYLVTASDDESICLYDIANAICLKTINGKKYGVDLVSFTSHSTTVIYSSKNGWDDIHLILR
ncbi:hypothetical protein HAX54_017156 [Datura stramonium]|uniref:Uncharacterized protein n=1 Tax=Datura stramonium TaxID=4076 RepID=A0ABS8UN35_DATST|nr:hypothetical protein [Datura stramonium]